jgi:regulator of replication initiation timing
MSTETLLQKLEEKMLVLLTELERLREELNQAKHENVALKADHLNYTKKLHGLVSLLDVVEAPVLSAVPAIPLETLQEKEDYAAL